MNYQGLVKRFVLPAAAHQGLAYQPVPLAWEAPGLSAR